MKKTILLYLSILLSVFPVAGQTDADVSFAQLRERASVSPHELLKTIDSLEVHSSLALYRSELLRAYAYRGLSMRSLTFYHARHALELAGIEEDTDAKEHAYMLLVESSVMLNHLDVGMEYIQSGKRYAHAKNLIVLEAYMLQMESTVLRKIGQTEKSYSRMKEAASILKPYKGEDELVLLSHIYGYMMAFGMEDGRYDEAWKWGKKRAAVILQLDGMKVNPLIVDNQKGYFYSKMAFLAEVRKDSLLAEDYSRKFYQTHFSRTPVGIYEINNYLLLKKDYAQVLANNRERYRVNDVDTLGSDFVNLLRQDSRAYSGLGNYEEAYKLMERIYNIREVLRTGEYKQNAQELMNLNEVMSQEVRLQKVTSEVRLRNYLMGGVSLGFLVVTGFLLFALRRRRHIRFQEHKIVSLVSEIADLKNNNEEAYRTEFGIEPNGLPPAQQAGVCPVSSVDDTETSPDSGSIVRKDQALFEFFDRKVRGEKLYLNYQLDRDDYASLMGVDRNRFAQILKTFAGGNLSRYLNDLRLDYSVFLLREYPEMSNQEIAERSALPKLSTFYRLFKEKYGVSPTVFRRNLSVEK